MRKNRSIKPKIRWKAKKSPDVWQGQHQVLEVQQALIFQNIVSSDCRGHYVDTVGKNTAKIAENSPDSLLQVQQYIRLKELEAELLQSLHCNMKKGK